MKIEIFKRKTQKKDGFPNYIIWDMDSMSRLSTATTYKLACEIKKDWEKLNESMQKSIMEEWNQNELPFTQKYDTDLSQQVLHQSY